MSDHSDPGDRISLARLPRALHELTGVAPPYQALYRRVLNCELPAEQLNGRWFVQRSDLATIAERVGLAVPAKGERRQRAVA